jgi:hypothetical protein
MFHSCSTAYSLFMGRSILSWRNYTSAFIAMKHQAVKRLQKLGYKVSLEEAEVA